MLDGVGAGLQSVAVPGLVARILNGTGRVNVGQGAVMTVQGLGASLSPAIGGWMAQAWVSATFLSSAVSLSCQSRSGSASPAGQAGLRGHTEMTPSPTPASGAAA